MYVFTHLTRQVGSLPLANNVKHSSSIVFIVDVWKVRKQKFYGEDACPSHRQCQTLAGDAGPVTGGGGLRVGKMGKLIR